MKNLRLKVAKTLLPQLVRGFPILTIFSMQWNNRTYATFNFVFKLNNGKGKEQQIIQEKKNN